MDILFLSHRIPYPPDKGDKIRSHALLLHLAKRHRVHVACFVDDAHDMEHTETVRRLAGGECLFVPLSKTKKWLAAAGALLCGQPITTACFGSRAMAHWIGGLQRTYKIDRTFVFCSAMAPYVLDNEALNLRHAVLDLVDIDSDKWRQYASSRNGFLRWIYNREAIKVFDLERTAARRFGATILATRHEAESFASMVPDCAPHIFALTNGVDREYFAPGDFRNPFLPDEEPIVMTGRMDYRPNAEGAKWFLDDVMPLVLKALPRARFYAVGADPPSSLRALSGARFSVTGRVNDVRPYLHHASAVVAPLRIARGVQNKVLEAMAMAKPVVTTSDASRGLSVRSGTHLWVRDDAAAFADAVIAAVRGSERPEIGRNARDYVEHHHDWPRNLSLLDGLLAEPSRLPPDAIYGHRPAPCSVETELTGRIAPVTSVAEVSR